MFKMFAFLATLLLLVCYGPAEATGGGIAIVGGQNFDDYSMDSFEFQADTTAPWQTGLPLQTHRLDLGAASHDGMLYAIAGHILHDDIQVTLLDSVEVLDTNDMAKGWSYGPPLQEKRSMLAAVALKGVVYAIGGYYQDFKFGTSVYCCQPENGIKTVEMLDTTDLASGWSYGPELKLERGLHAAVALDDKIYVMGGSQDWMNGMTESMEVLDTNDIAKGWFDGPPLQKKREAHGVAALNGKLYVVGGKDTSRHGLSPSLEILDTNNMAAGWSYGPELQETRRRLAAVPLNGMICAIGGFTEGHAKGVKTDLVELLDPNNLAGGWSMGETLTLLTQTKGRDEMAATAITEKGEMDVQHNSCVGAWCCDDSCTASFTVVTPQSGNGAACPTQHTCFTAACPLAEISATLGELTVPMQLFKDQYIYTPEDGVEGSSFSEPPTGDAVFTVRASTSTTIELEGEVLTSTDAADSFFVWFDDDAPFYVWEAGVHASFAWTPVGSTFALSAGTHTLHIGLREDGAQVRGLRISSGDAVFIPTTPPPKTDCQEGEDWATTFAACTIEVDQEAECPNDPAKCVSDLTSDELISVCGEFKKKGAPCETDPLALQLLSDPCKDTTDIADGSTTISASILAFVGTFVILLA